MKSIYENKATPKPSQDRSVTIETWEGHFRVVKQCKGVVEYMKVSDLETAMQAAGAFLRAT